MKKILGLFILAIFTLNGFILAHSGRTDSSGCHTCRTNCPSYGLSYGEYHCHGGSISYTTPTYTTPTYTPPVKTCSDLYGWNSQSAGNGKCSCKAGYVWASNGNSCILAPVAKTCSDLYGWNSIDAGNDQCKCRDGYIWNTARTSCVLKPVSTCGLNSSSDSKGNCACKIGYTWKDPYDSKNFDCVLKQVATCGLNSILNSSGKCICKAGYIWKDLYDNNNFDCKLITTTNTNTTNTSIINVGDRYKGKICRTTTSTKGTDGYCYCKVGYKLSKSGYACEKK